MRRLGVLHLPLVAKVRNGLAIPVLAWTRRPCCGQQPSREAADLATYGTAPAARLRASVATDVVRVAGVVVAGTSAVLPVLLASSLFGCALTHCFLSAKHLLSASTGTRGASISAVM